MVANFERANMVPSHNSPLELEHEFGGTLRGESPVCVLDRCDGKVDSTFSHPLSGILGFTGAIELLPRAEQTVWIGGPRGPRAPWGLGPPFVVRHPQSCACALGLIFELLGDIFLEHGSRGARSDGRCQ